jgi:hypothetical protein
MPTVPEFRKVAVSAAGDISRCEAISHDLSILYRCS